MPRGARMFSAACALEPKLNSEWQQELVNCSKQRMTLQISCVKTQRESNSKLGTKKISQQGGQGLTTKPELYILRAAGQHRGILSNARPTCSTLHYQIYTLEISRCHRDGEGTRGKESPGQEEVAVAGFRACSDNGQNQGNVRWMGLSG